MKAQRCHQQGNLVTFSLYLLGCYAEVWAWREIHQLEIIVVSPSRCLA